MSYKVLHIITRFQRGGGTEKNTTYAIQALDKTKFSVDIVVGKESDFLYTKSVLPEVEQVIMIDSLDNSFNPVRNLKAFYSIFTVIHQNNYAVVHTHQCKASILGCFAAKIAKVPVIIFGLHGDYLMNPRFKGLWRAIYKLMERIAVKCATMLISVGEEVKERYINRYNLPSSMCEVVHSGMELAKFYEAGSFSEERIKRKKEELNIKPEELVVAKVSSLEPRKGYKFAIQVAEKVIRGNNKDIKFLFVGEGDQRSELEAMVKRLRLEEKIIFTGFRRDLEEIMSIIDVFIFTSLMEGLPQVLVQAAAAGKPIVSFEIEGVREIVKENINGFIVPSRDVDALVEKVNHLLCNPEKAKEMGANGRVIIGDRWSIANMQERIRNIYTSLIQSIENGGSRN
jgi:glycosyltransferase involved in cell wall biosynthesis